ncbi:MAG: phosphotransferase [Pseudomonadota bacterium]
MRTRLQAAIAQWPSWPIPLSGPPERIGPLSGRTNHNARLSAPGLDHDLVLRLHHPDSGLLGIDRSTERKATQAAAEAGLGRPALHWNSSHDYALFPYIEARTWTSADLNKPSQRRRLRQVIDRLMPLRLASPRRQYAAYLQSYVDELNRRQSLTTELHDRWLRFKPELHEWDRTDWPVGLVHHDLIPANVLDTGERLMLIDFEYAAMGHADIDRWAIDPDQVIEPIVARLINWTNRLWEALVEHSLADS